MHLTIWHKLQKFQRDLEEDDSDLSLALIIDQESHEENRGHASAPPPPPPPEEDNQQMEAYMKHQQTRSQRQLPAVSRVRSAVLKSMR